MSRLFLLLTILVVFSSCNSKKKQAERNALVEEIKLQQIEFEKSFETGEVDFQAEKILSEKYELFVLEYADDSLAPHYLIQLGNIYTGLLADTEKAIEKYKLIQENYPESAYVPYTYFILADLYKTKLGDFENAEKYYSLLIEKFPNHEFTWQAQILLEKLNLTDEELFNTLNIDSINADIPIEVAKSIEE
ncbi:MAG: tetratricopeptide repeat protein [Bacteroidetes bacterium]|nr:tetratricopeptide repeat protein [Bacteroidota bacterium]